MSASITPLTRSKALRARASATRAMKVTGKEGTERYLRREEEHAEAMILLELMEQMVEGAQTAYTALSSRVFELADLITRGPNGHAWKNDLPVKENATAVYQALRSLVKWQLERAREAKKKH